MVHNSTEGKFKERDRHPSWYRDALIYEIHVRAFQDSDGDGIGDFPGLIQRLDYLQDLGITALWLLPFYPSPLRDDGYDVADYRDVHPDYGTLDDFKRFLAEAHRRDIKVITELVINHTSDQHPWFQRARSAEPGSRERDFYVWSDSPDKYEEARVIFQDFESSNWSYDSKAQAYYWHRFYEHQPDLNFENPAVREKITEMLDYWLEMGVDGLRLDAIPYLYEREGTDCENLPETHRVLKELRSHIDSKFEDRMLLAEANQWPEDAVEYFGEGDEAHMAYHFPLMPRLFMSLRLEDRFPVTDIMEQTPDIPEGCQWALFLRNHDELTLEMVTKEEREYMYQAYAEDPQERVNMGIRRRLAPLLQNNRRKIELMNSLLFSLPGTPVIYYGDELGMGDNPYLGDRDSVRTPMQWSPDRNAGFSDANPHRLYLPVISDPEYHYQAINVETQQHDPSSFLAWMKRLMSLRKKYRAFSRGDLKFLDPDNHKVLAFLRTHGEEEILVVLNLSRFTQSVHLDLSDYSGAVPTELFGRTELPRIKDEPYFLTLGPHTFYWFLLESPEGRESEDRASVEEENVPLIQIQTEWGEALTGDMAEKLEEVLMEYLPGVRWFSGKARSIRSTEIKAVTKLWDEPLSWFIPTEVHYIESEPETYSLVLAAREAGSVGGENSSAELIARLEDREGNQVDLVDAFGDPKFDETLLDALLGRGTMLPKELTANQIGTPPSKSMNREELTPSLVTSEQSNSAVFYGRSYFLKFFRKLEKGLNPDLEIGRFLTERNFEFSPSVLSSLEHKPARQGEGSTLAILQEFVPNEGDAWDYFSDHLSRYYERLLAESSEIRSEVKPLQEPILELIAREPPQSFSEMAGPYLNSAELLGLRTAQLHRTLSSSVSDPNFVPEKMRSGDRRSTFQSIRTLTKRTSRLLHSQFPEIPEELKPQVRNFVSREDEILESIRRMINRSISTTRIRCHGDYHLGQVLFTGNDFYIIDFEGEPERPLEVRRLKRSPLRDVAGMVRSFHYVAYSSLFEQESSGLAADEHLLELEAWAKLWYKWISAAFLNSYLEEAKEEDFIPEDFEELEILFETFILEKAIYELGYELNNRPNWLKIPLSGIKQIFE